MERELGYSAFITVGSSASIMANTNPQSRRWAFTYFLEPSVPSESDFSDDKGVGIFHNSVDLSPVDGLRGKHVRNWTIAGAVFSLEVCRTTGGRRVQGYLAYDKKRFNVVRKLFHPVNVQIARSSARDHYRRCT